jgi:hypothetical protein
MASRIVVFPVMGRRWAFTAVLPTAGAENVGAAAVHSPPPLMSLRELFNIIRATPSTGERIDILTNYGSDKVGPELGILQI